MKLKQILQLKRIEDGTQLSTYLFFIEQLEAQKLSVQKKSKRVSALFDKVLGNIVQKSLGCVGTSIDNRLTAAGYYLVKQVEKNKYLQDLFVAMQSTKKSLEDIETHIATLKKLRIPYVTHAPLVEK